MGIVGWILVALLAAVLLFLAYGYVMFRRKYLTDKPEAFGPNIAAYRKADEKNPPAPGKILFVGSSVMEFWKTMDRDLSPLPVLNRGIAGSKIVQWPHYVERLVLPYNPSTVVLYAGSNDMHGEKSKTPEQVFEAFREFASKVREAQPETKVFFIFILPSPNKARWTNWGKIHQANEMIRQYTLANRNMGFIDCTEAFLKDGLPRPELFLSDGVHPNAKGYATWAEPIKAALVQAEA